MGESKYNRTSKQTAMSDFEVEGAIICTALIVSCSTEIWVSLIQTQLLRRWFQTLFFLLLMLFLLLPIQQILPKGCRKPLRVRIHIDVFFFIYIYKIFMYQSNKDVRKNLFRTVYVITCSKPRETCTKPRVLNGNYFDLLFEYSN